MSGYRGRRRRRDPSWFIRPDGPVELSDAMAECCTCTWKWTPQDELNPEDAATDHTRKAGHATVARWPGK
jgi:hypothetical protein